MALTLQAGVCGPAESPAGEDGERPRTVRPGTARDWDRSTPPPGWGGVPRGKGDWKEERCAEGTWAMVPGGHVEDPKHCPD